MAELMLVMLLGLAGPLFASPRRYAIPVAVGEIIAGILFGVSGLRVIDSTQPNLALLSQIGFALVMMVTASHIDLRALASRKMIVRAGLNVLMVAAGAIALAFAVAAMTGLESETGMLAVIMASSSAAVVLPIFAGQLGKSGVALFLSQVAIADLGAVIVLPLVTGSHNLSRVLYGALAVTIAALVIYFLLRWAQGRGEWKRLRKFSAANGFGLELRISFILLLSLVWLAQSFAITIMIAGFGLGLAIAANGLPHRLAKQLFAVSEGFFSPVFFVLLGASINVTSVFASPRLLFLAVALGLGALLAHLVPVLLGLKARFAFASSAQLGVPAAAVSIGLGTHALDAGQAAAVMLGALMTLAATAIAAAANKSTVSA